MSADEFLTALRSTHARLVSSRPGVEAGAPWPLAERFDHAPEAAWGPPELLAHVAEMLPFWQGEVEKIVAGPPEPVPFGRVGTDPVRIALIGRDRSLPIATLYDRIDRGVGIWEGRLTSLTADEWAKRGLHPSLGEMTIEAIVRRMLLGHLAEHAEQLQGILAGGREARP